jgi:hypothetical protein
MHWRRDAEGIMKLVGGMLLLSVLAIGCSSVEEAQQGPDGPGGPGFPGVDFDGGVFPGFMGPQPSFGPTVSAPTPPPPLSGGTLLMLGDGKTAFAADPDRDQVYFVDVQAGTRTATVALTAGDEPGRAVADAAGKVHVVLRRAGAVAIIDPATATLSERKAVCPAPRGIAYDAANDRVHVACAGGELVSLPAAGGDAVRSRSSATCATSPSSARSSGSRPSARRRSSSSTTPPAPSSTG